MTREGSGAYMLIKLLPKQVSDNWPVLYSAIEETLPPLVKESADISANLLTSFLTEGMICWIIETDGVMKGVISTTFTHDYNSSAKSLLIYSLYSKGDLTREDLIDIYTTLDKYGRAEGCYSLSFYTDNRALAQIVDKVSFAEVYAFASIKLGGDPEEIRHGIT